MNFSIHFWKSCCRNIFTAQFPSYLTVDCCKKSNKKLKPIWDGFVNQIWKNVTWIHIWVNRLTCLEIEMVHLKIIDKYCPLKWFNILLKTKIFDVNFAVKGSFCDAVSASSAHPPPSSSSSVVNKCGSVTHTAAWDRTKPVRAASQQQRRAHSLRGAAVSATANYKSQLSNTAYFTFSYSNVFH